MSKRNGGVLKWTRVSDLGDVFMKILLYGESGSGKTHTACTAPKPCIILTEPNGLPTIRAANNPDAFVIMANSVNGGLGKIRQVIDAAKDGSLAKETGCETIVIDSLYAIQCMIKSKMLRDKASKQGAASVDDVEFGFKEWSILTDRMRRFADELRDLPFNVVAITHATITDNETTGKRYKGPSFQGKAFQAEIASFFSLVGLQFRDIASGENGETLIRHRVMFAGPESVTCKRLPGIDTVEEPDIRAWIEKAKSSTTKEGPVVIEPARKSSGRSRRSARGRASS